MIIYIYIYIYDIIIWFDVWCVVVYDIVRYCIQYSVSCGSGSVPGGAKRSLPGGCQLVEKLRIG